jgi:bla regulator protein BlaR1
MIQAICWVLIHSLWQGVLLALAGGGVILCTKRSPAAVRYRLLCGLAGIFAVGMGVTFLYEWLMATGSGDGSGGVGVSMSWLGDWCSAHAVQVVGVWLVVAVVKSVRMAAGWSYMRRMRREGLAAPALWVEKVDGLSRQLGIRQAVKFVESALVRVPVVIGQLRPIIYIPLGLINHLPASEMEAVLLHELAHIRRYDYVVNLVQHVAECLLFFNPGFLWISALIREERENCCDDVAIALTRDRVEFVRALVRFSEHSLRGMALAFPGNKRPLLHRVLRISRQENKTLNWRERLVLLGGCVVLLCFLVARAGRADVRKTAEPANEAQLAQVQPVKGVPADVIAVLRARQQVAQNMEWVQSQLDQLHHKTEVVKNQEAEDKEEEVRNKEQAVRNAEDQVARNEEQVSMQDEQVSKNEEQAEQAEQAQQAQQAQQDKQQADRDREQAERDRQQAEQDRHQAELDRQQAERDRIQAEQDRQKAREQAERDREQAERDRQHPKNN